MLCSFGQRLAQKLKSKQAMFFRLRDMQKSNIFCKNTLFGMCNLQEKMLAFLMLPLAQETSFFSAFLHGFNSGSKNSSVVGGVIHEERSLGFPLTGR